MGLRWGTTLALALLLVGVVHSQELSDWVFPSEDELPEALENGELSYEQFLRLREIIIHGVDSSSLYLLDEIPNLIYIAKPDSLYVDPLEQDQHDGFRRGADEKRQRVARLAGKIDYKYYQLIEKDERSWYRSDCDITIAGRFRARFRVNREKSGIERVVSRSFILTECPGPIEAITLGSFTTRLGLGSLYGYRGRLLDFSETIGRESLAYPDFGGYNGLFVAMNPGRFEVRALTSLTRDFSHRLTSAGGSIQEIKGPLRPGLVVGFNRLTDRVTDRVIDIPMLALFGGYSYEAGQLSAELSYQDGGEASAVSAVVEGRHRFETAELRFAGWAYADDFTDLTAGSKAGSLSVADTIGTVNFDYRSRRVGQSGLTVRTIVRLSNNLDFSNSLLYATAGEHDHKEQISSSLTRSCGNRFQLRLSYLGRSRRRPDQGSSRESDNRFRLETRFRAARLYARCYIGYNIMTKPDGHTSLFATVRYRLSDGSRLQIWSNMGRIDSRGVRYWYLLARSEWTLRQRLQAAAKLSNTYRREYSQKNTTQVSFELTASL